MKKIAIANRKGGVGKTTTAVNLAAGLSLAGNTVLLIDTDTQAHCSKILGVDPEKGLAELIDGATSHKCTIEARPGLFLLSGGKKLSGTARLIARQQMRSEYVLSEALKTFEGKYDYVIIDTPPGFNELSINVLFYAAEVLIPVSMEILAIDGLEAFLEEIESIKKYTDIKVRYIIPTFVDGRVKKTAEILELLKRSFPDKVTFPVHYSSRLSESPHWGKTIYEYDRRARVSQDYAKITGAIS